jgi:hypothetical protein
VTATKWKLLVGSAFTDARFMKRPSSSRDAAKCLSAELSELIVAGVPPLDILTRRPRTPQIEACIVQWLIAAE